MRAIILLFTLIVMVLHTGNLPAEEHPRVLIQRGERFLAMGNLDASLANYRRVTRHYPGTSADAEAHNDMGVIYARQGLADQAVIAYEQSLAINDYPLARFNLGKLRLARFSETGDEKDRSSALSLLDSFQHYLRSGRDLPSVIQYNREEIEKFLTDAMMSLQSRPGTPEFPKSIDQ